MSNDKLQEIKQALKVITPYPWTKLDNRIYGKTQTAIEPIVHEFDLSSLREMKNAVFIQNSPNYIEWLISQLEQAQEQKDSYKSVSRQYRRIAIDKAREVRNLRNELEQAQAENAALEYEIEQLREESAYLHAKVMHLEPTNQKLVEALEWFADDGNYRLAWMGDINKVSKDGVEIARQALASVKQE